MILSAMLVVTRDDAEKAGVALVREVYDFDNERELENFVGRVQLWLQERPVPAGEIGFTHNNGPDPADRLLEIIDNAPVVWPRPRLEAVG